MSSRILTFLEKLSQVSQSLDSIANCFAEILAVAWIVVCHDLIAESGDEGEDDGHSDVDGDGDGDGDADGDGDGEGCPSP